MLKITFEFVGGPKDGRILCGTLGKPSDAERYYLFSNHGAFGHRFKVASPYAVETLVSEQLKDQKNIISSDTSMSSPTDSKMAMKSGCVQSIFPKRSNRVGHREHLRSLLNTICRK